MTIAQIISRYSKQLKSSSPILDIELLLAFTLKKNKEYLYQYPEKDLSSTQIAKFEKLFARRSKGEPIAYILGHKEFYGLDFVVNKQVLIPRPETEILVEEVIKYYQSLITNYKLPITLIELGIGSGAILISLAKKLNITSLYGLDISAPAIKIAKKNASLHKVKINFLKGNLLQPILKLHTSNIILRSSIIVANLPYLDKAEENLLPSTDTRGLKFEPQIALYGGPDGLKYFEQMFHQIQKANSQPIAIFLEIGHNQADKIINLAKVSLPEYKAKVIKDLCGFDRVLIFNK